MTPQTKTYIFGTIGILVVVGLVGWSHYQNRSVLDDDQIKIGVIGTLTRLGQYQGQQQFRGLEIARDEINSSRGINGKNIEFIVEDSQADPAKAVAAFRKLEAVDDVRFMIGDSWNSTTVALLPVLDESNVLLISPVAGLDELSIDDMFFRTMPTVTQMMSALADYAYNVLGSRRAGVIWQENSFGIEHKDVFTRSFEELGGSVVASESISLTANDVRTELAKIGASNPDTILNVHASGPPIGLVMRQAQELGMDVIWLSHFGSENDDLFEQYTDVIDGLVYPYPYNPDKDSLSALKFTETYMERYGELPDLVAANSYDAMQVLALAMREVGENPSVVREYLLGMQEYEGASGTFSFDQYGDVHKSIFIKQIQQGVPVVLDSSYF